MAKKKAPLSKTSPQVVLNISSNNNEGVLFLTVPEDCRAGDRAAIHFSRRAMDRLMRELKAAMDHVDYCGSKL